MYCVRGDGAAAMTTRKIAALSLVGLLVLGLVACKPTPDAACQAAAATFQRCAKGGDVKWSAPQMDKCVTNVRNAGYEKAVKKCADMKDCETARTCLMIMLVGADKR